MELIDDHRDNARAHMSMRVVSPATLMLAPSWIICSILILQVQFQPPGALIGIYLE